MKTKIIISIIILSLFLSGSYYDHPIFEEQLDIIQKSGSWFSYKGERLGQGKDNIRKLLEGNEALFAEIDAAIRAQSGKLTAPEETFDVDDEEDEEFDLRALKMGDDE